MAIAHNSLVDFYRADKGEVKLEEEMIKSDMQGIEKDILLFTVFEKLKSLNQDEQELIILKYSIDLDTREIANVVGKNYEATKMSLSRALSKLKNIVNHN